MDLRHLKTLIAIAEHGSFAAAGDAIGLTQSAISLHIKALEKQLDSKLFDRTTRPPRLNARGRTIVDRAREIIEQCENLSEAVAGETLAGTLDIGAVPTLLSGILPPALSAIRGQHPDLRIRVSSGLSADLVGRVHNGELDGAVVSEPARLQTGLSWHPYAEEPLMVIAPKGTPGKTDRELLLAGPFIRFQRFAWAGRLIDTHLKDRGIRVSTGMEIDSLEAIAQMVAHGLGVSVVPDRAGSALPENIERVAFGDPPLGRVVGVVERRDNPKAHLIKAFVAILADLASEPRRR
ncbi:MAG: LysR family transcriptional regulator [Proteobacteria bacterium]|nr:LysR family transcriptional regulator [Pseudomonadota bacterium]